MASGYTELHDLTVIALQHARTSQLLGADFLPLPSPNTAKPQQTGAIFVESRDKIALLAELQREHDTSCKHCTSATAHTRTVFGEGNSDADLMFVGEAPGEEEDRTGRPFVGRAGKKLDEMINAMGLSRQQVYIANVLKSRPPNNRTPLEHECQECSKYLVKQIRIIKPHVLVALGGPAAKLLLRTDAGITRLRGQWGTYIDEEGGLEIPVMPTFHPAYLLRNYTVETRKQVWSDLQAGLAKISEHAREVHGGDTPKLEGVQKK